MEKKRYIVAAGHICLDIIPDLSTIEFSQFIEILKPGYLIKSGPAALSTGGPVSNTGLALHKLGVPTRLVGKVGADPLGDVVCSLVKSYGSDLAEGMIVDPEAYTSYSVIISPGGIDRIFLHYSGANDTFCAEDVKSRSNLLEGASIFHFGYPPLMRMMYQENSQELLEIMRWVKSKNVTTSLDMAFPAIGSDSGRANWKKILGDTLPYVDIFMPSIEEILITLRSDLYNSMVKQAGSRGIQDIIGADLLTDISSELIGMGVKIVGLKLGDKGLYLHTAGREGLEMIGHGKPANCQEWENLEIWAPCYSVKVAGTTGSGDATIAGFLCAIEHGYNAWQAANAAVAVGACNVEAPDALSGVCSWDVTTARVAGGWKRLNFELSSPGWVWDEEKQIWLKE